MKIGYYIRYIRWFFNEFVFRFWKGRKRSFGPNMTEDEYDMWFGGKNDK